MSENNEFTIDENVKEELENTLSEEGIIGMYQGGQTEEQRIPLVEQFSPDENDWGGKTILQRGQPRAITLGQNLPEAFPVLLPTQEFIDKVVVDYEKRLTSLEGVSREQLMKIFIAMFGGSPEGEGQHPNSLELMFSAGPENND